jgi:serine/threonine protein phosphatase PrpC
MSPLELVADQLAQLIEAADSPDRRALAQILTERLFQVLAIPPVPLELRVPFGNPFDPGVPLADWCLARLPNPETRAAALLPLPPIAALLDALAEADTPLLVFVPGWFRVDERGRPLVFPPHFSLGMKLRGDTHLSERQSRSYAHLLHPSVLKTLTHCDVRSSLLYSFALFLARTLLKVKHDDARALLQGLRRCRRQDRSLPPELPELLHAVLSRPLDRPPGCTCRELIALALAHVKDNPFVCQTTLNRSTEHELFAYSVFGIHKPQPVNEDRVLCHAPGRLPPGGNVSFALVADGVSQVDLGTGEMAAEEIVRLFRERFQARFDALAHKLAEQVQADPAADWTPEVEQLLQEFFHQANERTVALANQLRDPANAEIPHSPLCATLTAAVVVFDQALLAFVGDSPALLFRRATGRLSQLSTEDHVGLDEDYDPDAGGDPHALTRVIGQCRFNADKNLLEARPAPVPVVRVQLQPGDLLLLASDGLLECINEPTAQDRFACLEAELRRLHLTDHPLKQVVVHLIRLGEDGLSDDNISATAVRIHGAAVLDVEPAE